MLINTSVFDTMRSMEPLLKLLSPYDPKPQYVQVATGGNWENAVRIDFGNGTFSHDISSLGDVDDSIACEIFYTLSDGRAIFFGIRKSSALKVDSPEDFLEQFLSILHTASAVSLPEALAVFGQQLNNDPTSLTATKVDYVEIGVEGYWKSVGSKVLRKSGEPAITEKVIKQLLSENDSLLKNTKNHTTLEFAVRNPELWLGIQVSKKENDEYVTDLEAVAALSNLI